MKKRVLLIVIPLLLCAVLITVVICAVATSANEDVLFEINKTDAHILVCTHHPDLRVESDEYPKCIKKRITQVNRLPSETLTEIDDFSQYDDVRELESFLFIEVKRKHEQFLDCFDIYAYSDGSCAVRLFHDRINEKHETEQLYYRVYVFENAEIQDKVNAAVEELFPEK